VRSALAFAFTVTVTVTVIVVVAVVAVVVPVPGAATAAPAVPARPAAPARTAPPPPLPQPPPCPGCTLDVYGDPAAPMPLLVVLHGDGEQAATAAARWRAAARERRWALLALQCPTGERCKTSWWQWNGDPQWVRDRIAEVAAKVPIDRDRTYAAGWSGGATYLGLRAPAWGATFAAVVIHGGGMAPREEHPACPARALPVYFIVGDGNPLHDLARDLRDYFVNCKQEIEWALIPGADHAKEDRALDGKRALAVLDWLAARSRAARREDEHTVSPIPPSK
jgi:predicted esterase